MTSRRTHWAAGWQGDPSAKLTDRLTDRQTERPSVWMKRPVVCLVNVDIFKAEEPRDYIRKLR